MTKKGLKSTEWLMDIWSPAMYEYYCKPSIWTYLMRRNKYKANNDFMYEAELGEYYEGLYSLLDDIRSRHKEV